MTPDQLTKIASDAALAARSHPDTDPKLYFALAGHCGELLESLIEVELERDELAFERERVANMLIAEEDLSKAFAATHAALIAVIRAKAERQEAFAGPDYTQHTDADRQMFRHAAAMLRDLLPREAK